MAETMSTHNIEATVEADSPEEVIEQRIEYLENYTPRSKAHEESLANRAAELRNVLRLIESQNFGSAQKEDDA